METSEKEGHEVLAGSRTCLWCVPRVGSTALAKCLAFIEDAVVWSEPFVFPKYARIEYKVYCNADIPTEYVGNEVVFQKAKELVDRLTMSCVKPNRLS